MLLKIVSRLHKVDVSSCQVRKHNFSFLFIWFLAGTEKMCRSLEDSLDFLLNCKHTKWTKFQPLSQYFEWKFTNSTFCKSLFIILKHFLREILGLKSQVCILQFHKFICRYKKIDFLLLQLSVISTTAAIPVCWQIVRKYRNSPKLCETERWNSGSASFGGHVLFRNMNGKLWTIITQPYKFSVRTLRFLE